MEPLDQELRAYKKGWDYRANGRVKRVAPYKTANLAAAWLRGFDQSAEACDALRRQALGR